MSTWARDENGNYKLTNGDRLEKRTVPSPLVRDGSGRWTVYCSCSLCANKSPTFENDDGDAGSNAAEAWTVENGWLALPERPALVGPRRFSGNICRACVIDLRKLLRPNEPTAGAMTITFKDENLTRS